MDDSLKVNKPCATCKKAMLNVKPKRKYCMPCIRKKYERVKDKA